MKWKQKGISPKVVADLVVSVLSFLVAAGVVDIDPVAAAAIAKALGTLAGVIVGPGAVEKVREPATMEAGKL